MSVFRDALLRLTRAGYDLTDRQKCVLLAVVTEPRTVRSLAPEIGTDKSAITRAVDRLEAESLVLRVEDPADRRSVLIAVTDAGRTLASLMTVVC